MPSNYTDQDFLRSLFQGQSAGSSTPNGEKSFPGTEGFSFRTTGTTPDDDASSESELAFLLAMLPILAYLLESEEPETSEKLSSESAEKPSQVSTGMQFNAADRVRVALDFEGTVAYNSDSTAAGFYVEVPGLPADRLFIPKSIARTEVIERASEIVYDEGRPYQDACGATFMRRFDHDAAGDDRRWLDPYGDYCDDNEVCMPMKPMKVA